MCTSSASELSAAAACFVPCDYKQNPNPQQQRCFNSESSDHGNQSNHGNFWPPDIPYNSFYASRPPPFMNIPPAPLHVNTLSPHFPYPNHLPPPPSILQGSLPMFQRGGIIHQPHPILHDFSQTSIDVEPIIGKQCVGPGASYVDTSVGGFHSGNSRSAGDMRKSRGNKQRLTTHQRLVVNHTGIPPFVDNPVNIPPENQRAISILCHDQKLVASSNDSWKIVTNCSASDLSNHSQRGMENNFPGVRILSKSAKKKQNKKNKAGEIVCKSSINVHDRVEETALVEGGMSGIEASSAGVPFSSSRILHRFPADKPGSWTTETQTDFSDDLASLTLADQPNTLYHCSNKSTSDLTFSTFNDLSTTSLSIPDKPSGFEFAVQSLLSWSEIVNKPASSRSTSIGKPCPIQFAVNHIPFAETESQKKSNKAAKSVTTINRSRVTRRSGSIAKVTTVTSPVAIEVEVADPVSNQFVDMNLTNESDMKSVTSRKAKRNRKKKKVPTATLR